MANEPSMSEKAEQAARAGEDFRTTFLRERIWLDEDLCSQLEDFNRKLYEAFVHFTTYPSDDPGTQREYREAWKKAWQTVDQDAPPLRN